MDWPSDSGSSQAQQTETTKSKIKLKSYTIEADISDMPKRRKEDWLDVMTSLFAPLPWWLPFSLAALAWFGLPPMARAVVHQKAWDSFWPLVAAAVALALVFGGISAQVEKLKRRRLIARGRSLDTVKALSWREFEELCAEAYRRQGYDVSQTARGADGGVDLVLRRKSERIFVQCKHYAVRQVDVRHVRELLGVMSAEGATGGIFICSGLYTKAAREFAHRRITLIDGSGLLKLVEPVERKSDHARRFNDREI